LLEGDIPIEGPADVAEESEEQVSGADLDHWMQFEGQSIRGTESDVMRGLTFWSGG
jgi:hypothetical protein